MFDALDPDKFTLEAVSLGFSLPPKGYKIPSEVLPWFDGVEHEQKPKRFFALSDVAKGKKEGT